MLKIEMDKSNDIIMVKLEGVIDADSCRQFEESFGQLKELGDYKMIVDLSKLDYKTAVGVGIFMAAHNVTKGNQGNILLLDPKSVVKEVFKLIGLNQMITVIPDKETAAREFEWQYKIIEQKRFSSSSSG